MKNFNRNHLICLILALCLTLSVFVGCNPKQDATASSEPTVTDTVSDTITSSEEEETTPSEEDTDDWEEESTDTEDWEELPVEEEDTDTTVALNIDNTTVLNPNFKGINFIHQLYNGMEDKYDRMYTDKQVQYELDIMENMRVGMIRSYYGAPLSWDNNTKTYDWTTQNFQAFIQNCKDMQEIGVEVGITPQWSFEGFLDLVYPSELNNNRPQLYTSGFCVPGDFDATMKNYRKFLADSVLRFKAEGVNNVKYLFCFTECNNVFSYGPLQEDNPELTTTRERRQYDKLIPLFEKAIKATDGALRDAGLRDQYQIVAPCDAPNSNDNSEINSVLTEYCVKNLLKEVDIIGSHNGYDRSKDYTDDTYYDIPFENLSGTMQTAVAAGKPYWVDEYNASINTVDDPIERRETYLSNPYKGVAAAAMTNALMNMGGVDTAFLWTLFDQQWPDSVSGGQFDNGIQLTGYIPSLLESHTPRAPWYSISLISRYVQPGKVWQGGAESGVAGSVYYSAIERNDGEITVIVTSYDVMDNDIQISFEKSLGGRTFYRYTYDPNTIDPIPSSEMLKPDSIAKNVTDGFYDSLVGYTVAIYTTEKPN